MTIFLTLRFGDNHLSRMKTERPNDPTIEGNRFLGRLTPLAPLRERGWGEGVRHNDDTLSQLSLNSLAFAKAS